MSTVSVVIPCFNQGHLVDEAVESVLAQTYNDIEIIIVNDGSTDAETNRILKNYHRPRTTVLHTPNQRRSGARNSGIRAAKGEFILPLDADDRIGPRYVEQAVQVFRTHQNVGIVYSEAEYFGARTGKWELPPYRFPEILLGNVIFVSGLFRKSDWGATGGYQTDFDVWEDYDFWLSIIGLGREVVRLPDVHFYYRQHPESTMAGTSFDELTRPYGQIMRHHQRLYADNAEFMAEHIMGLRRRVRQLRGELYELRRSRLSKLKQRALEIIDRARRNARP